MEVEATNGSRIALDVGRPLSASATDEVATPSFAGPLLAALISHPHLDHYGLVDGLEGVPVYIGREAASTLDAASFFSPVTKPIAATGHLRDREPFSIGPFKITPYLVDHSAFDSYSLLIEVDGKRVFYTGDFRGHGRKAKLFDAILADPPTPIDVLICEGTHLQLDAVDESWTEPQSECDLENRLTDIARSTSGAVAIFASAQNLDRLVTAFRSARRSGRVFVNDLYTASVAAAARSTIPQPGFDCYRVYVPQRQRMLVKESRQFDRVHAIRGIRIFAEELAASPERFLVFLPSSTTRELLRFGVLASGARVLWSMWDGYLAEPSGLQLQSSLAEARIPFESLHTSGHASVADLRRLIDALSPTQLVPIHSEAPERFAELSERATPRADGTWWAA